MAVITKWRGADIEARMKHAVPRAMDDTLQAADDHATGSHWWRSRSGRLEREIVIDSATLVAPMRWRGRFGATRSGFYGYFLEHKTPWLRPAADATFRQLGDRIRRAFQ